MIKNIFEKLNPITDSRTMCMRRITCDACDVHDEQKDICTACGCKIGLKILFKYSSCPLEKW